MKKATSDKASRRYPTIKILEIIVLILLILVNTAGALLPSEIPNSHSNNRVDFNNALYIKGNFIKDSGKYEEVITAYDKEIEINPHNSMAWTGKGVALSASNKFDEAIKAYDKAIEINPQDSHAWFNKGNALTKLGKFNDAKKAYDKAIEINPYNSNVWADKRLVLAKLGTTPNPNTLIQTPNSDILNQTPNPNIISQTPNPNIFTQTPNPNILSQPSNPNILSQTPNPNILSQPPNPNILSQTPNPNIPNQTPNLTISSQTPNPNIPTQTTNPNISSQPPYPNIPNQTPNLTISSQTPNPNIPSQTPNPNIFSKNSSPMSDTTTELASLANEYTVGQIITLTATIGTTLQRVKKPSGMVTFVDGTMAIGTGTINYGQAILTTSGLSVGSHLITAQYSGDNNFKLSTSSIFTLTVLDKPGPDQRAGSLDNSRVDTKTGLTSTATEYVSGQLITFTAKVDTTLQETEEPSGTVTFIDGKTQIGAESVNSGQTILTTSALSVGSHSITAQYIGNNHFKPSTSPAFTLAVKEESIFHHPLFPVACAIIATVVGGFIRTKLRL